MIKEKELEKFAEKIFRLYKCKVLHAPNCVTRVIGGRFINIVVDKGNAGWPDLIVLGPEGRYLLIELKTETGRLNPDQIEFQEWCKQNNHPYHVLRTFDEIEQAAKALAGG